MYTKIDLTVHCVINPSYLVGSIAANGQGQPYNTNPAGVMKEIRAKLLKPRQALTVSFANVSIVPNSVAPGNGNRDARNGPTPMSCVMHQMTNQTFLMSYRIMAHYWENNNTGQGGTVNQQGNTCISNRWSEDVAIDECGYTTRTRSGQMVIRSDNSNSVSADTIRSKMAQLGVPTGFLRKSSKYKIQPDGLAIQYDIVDVEEFLLPPSPAFEADGSYTESATKQGAHRVAEVRVALKGTKVTDQGKLLRQAIAVAFNKIGAARVGATPRILSLVVRMPLYKNNVEVILQCQLFPGVSDTTIVSRYSQINAPNQSRMFAPPLGSNPSNVPPDQPIVYGNQGYLLRGSAAAFLQAAALYDPSLAGTKVDPATGQLTQGNPVGTGD